jgi:hypothetical protein
MRRMESDHRVFRLAREEFQTLREAARQVVALASVLPTLYFAIISFSDLRSIVTGLQTLLFLLPVVPWIASQALAARVLLPVDVPSDGTPQEAAQILSAFKTRYRRIVSLSYTMLIAGLVLLFLALSYYMLAVPTPPRS